MLKLHVIEAKFGDCLLLEFGSPSKFILIDGGPASVYKNSLQPALTKLMGINNTLEALIISHVDMDHIKGVLDLLADLKYEKDKGEAFSINIKELWLNSFSKTIDREGEIKEQLNSLAAQAASLGLTMPHDAISLFGIQEGNKVLAFCSMLEIPINKSALNDVFLVTKNQDSIDFSGVKLAIIGPTRANLKALEKEWKKWIEKQNKAMEKGNFNISEMADKSVPNLSSICFLASDDSKTILFTGDARGDHILEGLKERSMLTDGKFHCDIFKVPHHGSKNNVDFEFFKKLTADTYVISADGKYDNPDFETLKWIVDAAKLQSRDIRLILTNSTDSSDRLQNEYPPAHWNYTIEFVQKNNRSITI